MGAFFVGPLGGMKPLEVERDVSFSAQRGTSELVTSGGIRYVQRGRKAPRAWTVANRWVDPAWVRLLSYAAQGLIEECYLYDVAVARQNLLRATDCVGAGDPVLVDGAPMGALPIGVGPRAYLLAGRTVHVSCWTSVSPAEDVLSFTHAGNTLTLKAPPGTGSRYAYATYIPMSEGVITTQILGRLSGLRVHEGTPDRSFQATQGTPCIVEVQDPSQVLRVVLHDITRIDYTVTLAEVGQPTF